MKKILLILLSGVFFLYLPAQDNAQKFTTSSPEKAGFDKSALNRIDSVFSQLIVKGTIPHAVTFIARNGKIVHNKAFGWKNIAEESLVDKQSIFRNASQTKLVTSVAILMLMEEGKLLLDDPVKKYIPEFGKPVVLESFNPSDTTFTTRPAKRDITIRHLLTHSAGISYGNDKTRKIYDKAGVPIFPVLSKENITLAEAMKRLAGCPLEHDPGDKFTYGMNTDVLGLIIEVASGMPVDVFFSKKILEPLGMKDTHFYLPEDKINRLVTMYSKNSPDAALVVNEKAGGLYQTLPYSGAKTLFSTGAGLCGTIEDYARLCQMILNGGTFNGHRLLSRKTVELMNKNQLNDLRGENGYSLAYEVVRSDKSGKSILSDGSLTWGGWYGTDYVIDPKENLILLMYLNTEPLQTGFELKRLYHNLVYQALK